MYEEININRNVFLLSEDLIKQKEYWTRKLSGPVTGTQLSSYDEEDLQGGEERRESGICFSPRLSGRLIELCRGSDLSLYIVLLTALKIVLRVYTGNEDIIVLSPVYKSETVDEVFNHRVIIRDNVDEELSYKELILEIRRSVLEAYENQDYPYNKIMEDNPFSFSNVLCLLRNIHRFENDADIVFSFERRGEDIDGGILYDPGLYPAYFIGQILGYFKNVLEGLVQNIDAAVSGELFLGEGERKQLLYGFNQPGSGDDTLGERLIFESFERAVEQMPDNITVVHGDTQLTYSEINRGANRFARVLRAKGLKPDGIAAIMMDRSVEMIIGILGILKAGGAYLPIDPNYPQKRILFMLKDSGASILVTKETLSRDFAFTALKDLDSPDLESNLTPLRPQIKDFDALPIPDRSLVDYEKYHRYIGEALAKHTITIQATRGCPFKCAFCHKIWPKSHVCRSAENIFCEVKKLYDIGVRRFVFVDDIFNLNRENSGRFFRLIIENGLKVQLFFTNGLRGDILTEEFIDLMVEAGTVDFDFSLESASPRIQKLIQKNLDINKLKKTIDYIATRHPHVIIELQTMLGFPTETEEEALMTLDYIKSLKWVDFPYVHFLRIFPGTDMEKVALANGISREAIQQSADLAYHEYAETMPFSKEFSKLYQTRFFNEYFLLKERFTTVLRKQMKILTEGELIQKYDSFFPTDIKTFDQLLSVVGISREDLGDAVFLDEDYMAVPDVNQKIKAVFSGRDRTPKKDALKVLLLDLSQFFTHEAEALYDVVEVPLGLMYLLTYLNEQYGGEINGKIAKSRIDFDSYWALIALLDDFKPDIIGIRTLNYYKDFFHKTISLVRQHGIDVPIVAGGPYATTSYREVLNNSGVDIVVLGEGEKTFAELIGEILENNGELPPEDRLKTINGIAYISHKKNRLERRVNREIIFMDQIAHLLERQKDTNPESVNTPSDLAYIVYTSGSTGEPKGVMVEHRNAAAYLDAFSRTVEVTSDNTVIQQASFSFDTYVEEVFPFLLKGGKVALPGKYEVLDTALLRDFIVRHRVDTIDCSPLLLNQLNRMGAPAALKTFISGGDALRREYIDNLLEQGDVYNSYGPTETTVCVTFSRCSRGSGSNVPIGRPLPGYCAFVLAPNDRLLPVGVPGELCVSGRGVTRGYLNRTGMTAEKFVENPFFPGQRMYRTGDLAVRLPDGNLKFIGRIDQQVKIRGFRIELGEIERKLLNHNDIREAAAVVKENESAGKTICIYFEASEEKKVKELRHFLSSELPEYMIPSAFVQLEKIPVTPTGKLDRELLSRMSENTTRLGGEYTPPGTGTEKQMVTIWQDIFDRETIGIDDNFFELGGDSLLAIRTISRIREEMQAEISLKVFFEFPTIRALAKEAAGAASGKKEITGIKRVSRDRDIPLSFSQERLWFLQKLDKNSIAYYVPRAIRMIGKLDVRLLERVFTELTRRHEILRTVFPTKEGEGRPVQRILEPSPFRIPAIDFSHLDGNAQVAEISQWITGEGQRSFDLEKGPMMRVTMLHLRENENLVVLTEHHLIHDGWTQGVLLKEFIALFTAYWEGGESPLPPLPIQYADYAVWQRDFLQGDVLEQHLAYWKEKLAGLAPLLELPLDRPRPPVISGEGALKVLHLSERFTGELKEFNRENSVTLFMTMLTAFKILLYRYTGTGDLCVGVGIANRSLKEMEGMLGMVINTLALRTRISGEVTVSQCVKRVEETCLEAYEYRETPLEKIVEVLRPERSLSYTPLFQVMFSFMDTPTAALRLPGLELEVEESHNRSSKFDLNIIVRPPMEEDEGEGAGETVVEWEYNTDIFENDTMERMLNHYQRLLREMSTSPGQPVSSLAMLEEEEVRELLYRWNHPDVEYPNDKTVHGLFEEQVCKFPDRIAVMHGHHRITYRDLDAATDSATGRLVEKGVKPGDIVALMLKPSIEMMVGILSVLKADAGYLPIDPGYPRHRIDYMLEDSASQILVTAGENKEDETVRRWENKSIYLENLEKLLHGSSSRTLTGAGASGLAYVIYTSGTTGKPKGTIVEHCNIVRLMFNDKFQFDFSEKDTWTLFHSYCFDFSVWEMYGALLYGGKLVIIPKTTARDTRGYLDILRGENVTVLNQTPSAFYNLCDEELRNTEPQLKLRYIIFGGEALSPLKLKEWKAKYPHTRLINMYGITETTVHVTYREVTDEDIESDRSNIGKPIPTLSTYVVDRDMRLVPPGVIGELLVGGKGVARGYLNRPALTDERFIDNPYIPGERLYRSGDLVKMLSNGDMVYAGRIDHQVKIRGYRVELGEIENRLAKHPGIRETVVLAGEDETGDKYLCAYIVGGEKSREIPGAGELREYLSRTLPNYMVPSYFVFLEAFPLTSNGKLDRKALPEPGGSVIDETYLAPRDEIERKLVEIWSEVLGIGKESIGIDANFFELGGHSLKIGILATRIHKTFNVKIELADVFMIQTIRELAEYIESAETDLYTAIEPAPVKEFYALSSAQKRLYFLNRRDLDDTGYNMPMVLVLNEGVDVKKLKSVFRRLIRRHESLRTAFIMIDDTPVQRIYPDVDFQIDYYDLGGKGSGSGEPEWSPHTVKILHDFVKPFDLSRAPLLRVGLIKEGEQFYTMIVDIHHIISDGTSHDVLAREFAALYAGRELQPLKLQYKDYSEWQNNFARSEIVLKQKEYWLKQFEDHIPVLNLPIDYPRPIYRDSTGVRILTEVPEPVVWKLKRLALNFDTTLYTVLLAAFTLLLARISGQDDIVVGSPVSGRTHADLHPIIGLFANMLPMRNRPREDKTFSDFLEEVKENTLRAFANQDFQFDQLVNSLKIKRDPGRHPLFDAVLALQNVGSRDEDRKKPEILDNFKVVPYPYRRLDVQHDFLIMVEERGGKLDILVEYAVALFKPETIDEIWNHFLDILEQVGDSENLRCPLKDIRLSHDAVVISHDSEEEGDFNF